MTLHDKIKIVEKHLSTFLNDQDLMHRLTYPELVDQFYCVIKRCIYDNHLIDVGLINLQDNQNTDIYTKNNILVDKCRYIYIPALNLQNTHDIVHNFPTPYHDTMSSSTTIEELEEMLFEIMVLNGVNQEELEVGLALMYVLYNKFVPIIPNNLILRIRIEYTGTPQYIKDALIEDIKNYELTR